jgi:gas vesicle protein
MGRFINGVLVGLGVSLLIAPKPGKELRQLLVQSWKDMRSLPTTTGQEQSSGQKRVGPHKPPAQERGEHIPSAQEVAQRAAQRGTTVPETSQQPTQQAGPNVLPPRQDDSGRTKSPRPPRPAP